MKDNKKEERRQEQIEEMTAIWSSKDEYGKGFLDGIIAAVMHLAAKEHPVA